MSHPSSNLSLTFSPVNTQRYNSNSHSVGGGCSAPSSPCMNSIGRGIDASSSFSPRQQSSLDMPTSPYANNNDSRMDHCFNRHVRLDDDKSSSPQQQRRPLSRKVSERLGPPSSLRTQRRKRALIFTKILLKILRKQHDQQQQHNSIYHQAKTVIAECIRRNRYSRINHRVATAAAAGGGGRNDNEYYESHRTSLQHCELVDQLEQELQPLVGTNNWNRTEQCLELYLQKQTQRFHLVQQQQRQQKQRQQEMFMKSNFMPPHNNSTAVSTTASYRAPDPLEVLRQLQGRT